MALTPRSGFSTTTSGQNDIPNEIPNTQSDIINNMPYVTDGSLNKYAIDTTQYPETTKQLVGFIKGKRVTVTYYRRLRTGGTNIRTNIADYATTRDSINTEYQKIIGLEFTLPKGFEFTPDQDNASASITGSAIMYNGMNASVGDLFVTGTGDGRVGVFRISSVAPTIWRDSRVYMVNFTIQSFLDPSDSAAIEASVTSTFYFDKTNYLGGTASLLAESTYISLEKIKVFRSNLAKYFHQQFFSEEISSFLRPDGIYDPLVVYYMTSKITMDDVKIRAKNLMGRKQSVYDRSIWSRLEDRFNTTINGIYPKYAITSYDQNRLGIFMSELISYPVLSLLPSDDADEYYLFSAAFWTNDVVNMNSFEKIVHDAIATRKVADLDGLVDGLLSQVYNLTPLEQFYRIPIYLHLIDIALQSTYREIDAPSMGMSPS